jgi:hypothetical protein
VSGTVTGVTDTLLGPTGSSDLYRITGLSLDAAATVNLVDNAASDSVMFPFLLGGDDTIAGSGGMDTLKGFAGNDTIRANGGNDTIVADAGNDSIDGGTGWDGINYTGSLVNYKIERTANGFSVTDLKGDGGTDQVSNVENLYFDDKTVLLNVTAANNGGAVFRMYQAAMDRTPDLYGIMYWIAQMDAGVRVETLADQFIKSNEYRQLYGSDPGNHDLVAKYYEHILHRAPEQGGLDFWTNVLDKHLASNAQVLAAISESHENVDGTAALLAQPLVFDAMLHTLSPAHGAP